MLQAIEQAKMGEVVPVYKVVEKTDALDYFEKLSNYGRAKNALLFEFKDEVFGSANPCLYLKGFKEQFEITALNELGIKFLAFLKGDFNFSDKVHYGKNKITGTLRKTKNIVSEEQRLRLKGHMDIIRRVAFKFKPTLNLFTPYCGLFGAFSYDFVEHFEDLPEKEDQEPYYEFYFLDNLFVNKEDKTYFIANALIMDDKKEKSYQECLKTIKSYEKILNKKIPAIKKCKAKEHVVSTDAEKPEFGEIINNVKKNILEGDIYQAFPSRTVISNYNAEPFDVYKQLRAAKQQYMFYVNSDEGILFGASPEMSLKVRGKEEKTVEVKLITGTKPLGFKDKTDIDIENRYEAELKIDFKEIAKNIMKIDSVRNDVARVSKLGSRHLDNIFVTEKRSNEQHSVSDIKGTLKEDLDALHAYISCMNRLSGYPKIKAMRILRQFEKNKRGYFSGSVCYMNPDMDFYGAVIKNAIRLKNKKAYIGVNADVVYETPADEGFKDTEKKAKICLGAIKLAGGLK